MKVDRYCRPTSAVIEATADIVEAAQLMLAKQVGFLIVLDKGNAVRKPVGVLTGGDIVLKVTACRLDPGAVKVEEVMTRQPMMAKESDSLGDVTQQMRLAGIRHAPVIDARGALKGIISVDDVFNEIARLLDESTGEPQCSQAL